MTASNDPIAHFLGRSAARGGPFALLGVSGADATPAHVIAALESRLDQVDKHAESQTPNADEVRLALHAAAVQLLDTAVYAELRGSESTVTDQPASGETRNTAIPRPQEAYRPDDRILRLERDALILIGTSGGWNKQSRRRLLGLAHARGLTADDVAHTVARFGGMRHSESVRPTLEPTVSAPSRRTLVGSSDNQSADVSASDSRPSGSGIFGYFLASGAIMLAVAAGAWLIMGTPGSTSPRERTNVVADAESSPTSRMTRSMSSDAAGNDNQSTTPPDDERDQGLVARLRLEPDRLLRWLRQTGEALDGEPKQVLDAVRMGIDAQSVAWVSQPIEIRRVVDQETMNLLLACMDREWLRDDVIAMLIKPIAITVSGTSDDAAIPAATWSAAMANRMAQRPGMAAALAIRLSGALDDAGVGGFRPGDGAESARMLELLGAELIERRLASNSATANDDTSGRRNWATWALTLKAATIEQPNARDRSVQRVLTGGLARVVSRVDADRLSVALGELVPLMDWSASGTARSWLLDVIGAPGIRDNAIRALTQVLTTTSADVTISPTMVLVATATTGDRARLRDAYAAAWSLSFSAAQSAQTDAWLIVAEAHMEAALTTVNEPGVDGPSRLIVTRFAIDLADAAASGALSRIAALQWEGASDAAASELLAWTNASDTLSVITANTRAGGMQGAASDGVFAVDYLKGRQNGRVPEQQAAIARLAQRSDDLGAVDADVLLIAAGFGETREVREAAVALIKARRDDPAVLDAALELLPMVPRTRYAVQWLAELADVGELSVADPEWKRAIRAGLVQRVLDRVTGVTELDVIDALADRLARTYSLDPRPDDADDITRIGTVVRSRAERWIARAEQSRSNGPDGPLGREIRARASSRSTTAVGPLQRFVVEQRANAEALAAMVESERVGATSIARAMLSQLGSDLAASTSVTEQIRLIERVRLRLWRVLLRGDDS